MKQGHDWDPAEYKKHSGQQQVWARELIAKLNLKGRERVLDLGCGDGKVTVEIASRLPEGSVLGIDLSAEMVSFAQKNFPAPDHPNLAFQQGDAASLDLEADFDLVFSNAALHWVMDHGPVLQGIARALKPGGWALLQMGGKGNAAQIVEVMEQVTAGDQWREYFSGMKMPYGFHGPEEYRPWLAQAGLVSRRLELIPKIMEFKGEEGLKGWMRTTWLPYISRVPEERKEDLIAEVAAAYLLNHPPDERDVVRVEMVRLEADLVKPA